MPYVEANGIQMYYESVGEGEPLVLLHGLGSRGEDWALQVPAFAAHYLVITPDCRGHGRSEKPPGPYSMELFAQDVLALLDRLGVEGAHLVGLSMGGMVAQQMALDAPQRARSLVLVNTYSHLVIRGLGSWMRVLQRVLLLRLGGMRRFGEYIAGTLFPKPEQRELYELTVERWAQNDRRAYQAATAAVFRFNVTERLGKIRCPTLILAGDRDQTVPLPLKEELHQSIPGSELVVVPDSGHATPLDQPAAFNRLVLAFLAGVGD